MPTENVGSIFVGGRWMASGSTATIDVVDPATDEVIAQVPAGAPEDVTRAVAAARAAFEPWSAIAPSARAQHLRAIRASLERRAPEIAESISREMGIPRALAEPVQVRGALATLESYAAMADTYPWEEEFGEELVIRAPVGVVAAITPWNFPLGLLVDKVAPALLAGCTVVAKPSEVAPLSAWALAEAVEEAGLPAGVFNLLSGDAAAVGEPLVCHPDIDMVSFTGSTRAGRRIAALAGDKVMRLLLEMGGKSANVLLDDADLDAAIPASVMACYLNSGQVCVALSRLLVPRASYEDVVARVKVFVEGLTVGDPTDPVDLGPVVSRIQMERVRSYIETGIKEGARLVTGGPDSPDGLGVGCYVRPTVFADVENSMTIAQDEIFGPVLSVIAYETDDDAVRIANDSPYGLFGAVWSADTERAARLARRIRTGSVSINGQYPSRNLPSGGFKQSGIGRAHGRYGLDEYVELQAISGLAARS